MYNDDSIKEYSVSRWFKHFEDLKNNYKKWLISKNVDDEIIKLSKIDFETMVKDYYNIVNKVKKFAFGDDVEGHKIDQHKIAAIYTVLILKYKPFSYNLPPNEVGKYPARIMLIANELFCLTVVWTILFGWNDLKTMDINIPRNYESALLKLLHYYKNNINEVETLDINLFIQPLAHIFYFIEFYLIKYNI